MVIKFLRSALVVVSLFGFAAAASHAQTTEVKKEPIQMTSAASGVEMFNSYCAACHGKDAKGDGPAASALKVPPADLTQLAKKNNGKFPADHVGKRTQNRRRRRARLERNAGLGTPVLFGKQQRRRHRADAHLEPDSLHRDPSGKVTT